jgi:hypothetical protein
MGISTEAASISSVLTTATGSFAKRQVASSAAPIQEATSPDDGEWATV